MSLLKLTITHEPCFIQNSEQIINYTRRIYKGKGMFKNLDLSIGSRPVCSVKIPFIARRHLSKMCSDLIVPHCTLIQASPLLCFWYIVNRALSGVCVYSSVHQRRVLEGTRNTRPCITGHPVHAIFIWSGCILKELKNKSSSIFSSTRTNLRTKWILGINKQRYNEIFRRRNLAQQGLAKFCEIFQNKPPAK